MEPNDFNLKRAYECSFCFETLGGDAVGSFECGHEVHELCAARLLSQKVQVCSECNTQVTGFRPAYMTRKVAQQTIMFVRNLEKEVANLKQEIAVMQQSATVLPSHKKPKQKKITVTNKQLINCKSWTIEMRGSDTIGKLIFLTNMKDDNSSPAFLRVTYNNKPLSIYYKIKDLVEDDQREITVKTVLYQPYDFRASDPNILKKAYQILSKREARDNLKIVYENIFIKEVARLSEL